MAGVAGNETLIQVSAHESLAKIDGLFYEELSIQSHLGKPPSQTSYVHANFAAAIGRRPMTAVDDKPLQWNFKGDITATKSEEKARPWGFEPQTF